MLWEVIYMIGMVGVIACNGLILIAQYQLRRSTKVSVNVYVASLSVSAIIFACIFAPTVFTAYFQTLAPSFVCFATPYIQLVCVSSTAFCLVAVAANLYMMVVRATGPGQPHGSRSRKAAISLLIVWLVSLIYSARIFIELFSPEAGGDFELHDDDDDDLHGGEEEEDEEECILFIETDVDDVISRAVDVVLLYVLPIAVQIFFYVKVARKLWSSQVSRLHLYFCMQLKTLAYILNSQKRRKTKNVVCLYFVGGKRFDKLI